MARSMIKIKNPFDMLVHWNEYLDFINHSFSAPEEKTRWIPEVDIREKDGMYQLKLNIPGFSLQDIKVSYKNGFMTIEGKKKAIQGGSNMQKKITNNYYDNFKSVVRFPNGILQHQIRKALKNSILKIQVPTQKERLSKQ